MTSDNDVGNESESDKDIAPKKRAPKGKSTAKRQKSSGKDTNLNDPSSEDEPDGLTALRGVKEAEQGQSGMKRGPASTTRTHWHSPTKLVEPGSSTLRWKFKCRYCKKYVSIPTVICRFICLYTCLVYLVEHALSNSQRDAIILTKKDLYQNSGTLQLTFE
jgi:hypothetical protein